MAQTMTEGWQPWQRIALMADKIALALVFLATGGAKLSGVPFMVDEFARIGFGQWFRYFTGGLEIIGVIGLLIPALSAFGAIILLGIAAGAFVVQLLVVHGDLVHPVVLVVLIGMVIWVQREQIVRTK